MARGAGASGWGGGGSGAGGAKGRREEYKSTGFSMLSKFAEKQDTKTLTGAFSMLNKKSMQSMSNEEKMALASISDELFKRNKVVWDESTGRMSLTKEKGIMNVEWDDRLRSYKIDHVTRFEYGYRAQGKVLMSGKWVPIKGEKIKKDLVEEMKKRGLKYKINDLRAVID